MYPYQKKWIEDLCRLKIASKARRIGYSFAAGFGKVQRCLEAGMAGQKENQIILSRGERQSKEFISESIAPHVRALGAIAHYSEGYIEGMSILKHEVEFANGCRIIALPANPDTARSYEANVTLDEFAFHLDARAIYQAIAPSIARGYTLEIISTPNGQQGAYYELSKEAGLVDGEERSQRWSAHKTDIFSAIQQGCQDRFGNALDANELRLDCIDEEMWLQEYCCQFLSIASQWIPPDLFERCVDGGASDAKTEAELDEALYGLLAGWDIARNKDLSVIWLTEAVGDISWTRGVIEMKDMPTPDQMAIARRLMKRIRRLVIDKTSMGLSMFEQLEREFGGSRVEGVHFTLQTKEALAVQGKRRMEEGRVRLPDSDMIRNSFRSVKKTVTATGNARFDAEHDEKYGHADHWWAYCLAENAGYQPKDGFMRYLEQARAKQLQDQQEQEQDVRRRHSTGVVVPQPPAPIAPAVAQEAAKPDPAKPGPLPKPFSDPYQVLQRPPRGSY
ncbi:MAG: terminase large subunit domain-containing protein [Mycobacteriales bacterium]